MLTVLNLPWVNCHLKAHWKVKLRNCLLVQRRIDTSHLESSEFLPMNISQDKSNELLETYKVREG